MTSIALCDDDMSLMENVSHYIIGYFEDKNDVLIDKFNNPEIFIKACQKNDYDLIFLDIGMKPYTGIEVADMIREFNQVISIIFLTGFSDYYKNALDVHAFAYIVKPVDKSKIHAALKDYYSYNQFRVDKDAEYFIFSSNRVDIKLEADKIIYFEQFRNKTKVVADHKTLEIYASLADLSKKLPDYFTQCHRSFIVNMNKIETRDNFQCYMENKVSIPIARTKKQDFLEQYSEFLRAKNELQGSGIYY